MRRFRWFVAIILTSCCAGGLSVQSAVAAGQYCGNHKIYQALKYSGGEHSGNQYASIRISGNHASWRVAQGYAQCAFHIADKVDNGYNGGHSTHSFTTPSKADIDYVIIDVAKCFVVTISASSPSAHPGQSITFSGVVTPHVGGSTVFLQRYTSDGWVSTVHATLNTRGRYHFKVTLSASGAYKYRVHKSGNRNRLFGNSRAVAVTVS